jgi:hypothetical protein
MNGEALQQKQARDLVRLRDVRMRAAGAALAEARRATAAAQAARDAARDDAALADARTSDEQEGLVRDPGQAERRLALLDEARFRQAMAEQALADARAAEAEAVAAEKARRKAMILARARLDVITERVTAMTRRLDARREERAAMDAEDVRRFR